MGGPGRTGGAREGVRLLGWRTRGRGATGRAVNLRRRVGGLLDSVGLRGPSPPRRQGWKEAFLLRLHCNPLPPPLVPRRPLPSSTTTAATALGASIFRFDLSRTRTLNGPPRPESEGGLRKGLSLESNQWYPWGGEEAKVPLPIGRGEGTKVPLGLGRGEEERTSGGRTEA